MAVFFDVPILGQEAITNPTYCYLYEPFVIKVRDNAPGVKKLYIDMGLRDVTLGGITGNDIDDNLIKYAEFDTYVDREIDIDLMKLVNQHHNANVYKFNTFENIGTLTDGARSAVNSNYIYRFRIYSDVSSAASDIRKLPLVGGRSFEDFTPVVDINSPFSEAELYGLDMNGRWIGYPYYTNLPLAADSIGLNHPGVRPLINTSLTGKVPCGGMIIWKSRFGGWMSWGMDIKKKTYSKKYTGDIDVGMFEYSDDGSSFPYVAADYSRIENSYSLSLKALGLSALEMKVVAGINHSPAVYYITDLTSKKVELMRATSISTPESSLARGGDFAVTLSSISRTGQKTR